MTKDEDQKDALASMLQVFNQISREIGKSSSNSLMSRFRPAINPLASTTNDKITKVKTNQKTLRLQELKQTTLDTIMLEYYYEGLACAIFLEIEVFPRLIYISTHNTSKLICFLIRIISQTRTGHILIPNHQALN